MNVYRLPIAVALLRLTAGIAIALHPAENGWSVLYFLIMDFPGVFLYAPIERLIPSIWTLALLGAAWWYLFALLLEYCFLQLRRSLDRSYRD